MTSGPPTDLDFGFDSQRRPLGFDLRIFDDQGTVGRLATGERALLDARFEDVRRHLHSEVPLDRLSIHFRSELDPAGVAVASDPHLVDRLSAPLLDDPGLLGIDLEITNAGPPLASTAQLLSALLGREREGWEALLASPRQGWANAGGVQVPKELSADLYEAFDLWFIENDEWLVRRDVRIAYGSKLALTIFSRPLPQPPSTNRGLGSRTKRELATPDLIRSHDGPGRIAIALEDLLNHTEWTAQHLDHRFEAWESRLFDCVEADLDPGERVVRLRDLQRELATMLRAADGARDAQRAFSRRLSTRMPDTSPHFHRGFRQDGLRRLADIATIITEHRGRVREGFNTVSAVIGAAQAELASRGQRAETLFQKRLGVFAGSLVVPSLFIAAFGANDLRLPTPGLAAWLTLVGGAVLMAAAVPLVVDHLGSDEDLLAESRPWLTAAAAAAAAAVIAGAVVAS